MGARGPVGKGKDEKAGHRTKEELGAITQIDLEEIDPELLELASEGMIPADESWHPVAAAWYESLRHSGQRVFYQPSDWATAYIVAESLSRDMKPQVIGIDEEGEVKFAVIPLKGSSLAAYLKAFTALMATEGDRRRMNIELRKASLLGQGKDDVTEDGVVLDRRAMFGGKSG